MMSSTNIQSICKVNFIEHQAYVWCALFRYIVNAIQVSNHTRYQYDEVNRMVGTYQASCLSATGYYNYDVSLQYTYSKRVEAIRLPLSRSIYPTFIHISSPNTFIKTYSNYRYGFNGMEKDDEVKGPGNSYDFGARMYDSRLGRFYAIDPLYFVRPGHTPYSYAGNMPVWYVDFNGEIPIPFTVTFGGRTYTVTLDNEDPQYIKIKENIPFVRSFRMRFVSNNGNRTSMDVLENQHSNKLKFADYEDKIAPDVKKLESVYSNRNGDVLVSGIIRALLDQHGDKIGLVIIGNHAVPTREEAIETLLNKISPNYKMINAYRDGEYSFALFTSCDDPNNPGCVAVTEENRSPLTETQWTLDRANYVKQELFRNDPNIQTYSAGSSEITSTTFPGVTIAPLGNDARGINIFFDFRNTEIPSSSRGREKETPDNAKSKNPRFL